MNHCWKCGRLTNNVDPECDLCASGASSFGVLPHPPVAALDLTKIQTFEEAKYVLQVVTGGSCFLIGSPIYNLLKKFMTDQQ